jgi:hypothetical protein
MWRRRAQFTIRSILIATALVGLNLAGAIATSKYSSYFPESHPVGNGGDQGVVMYGSDCSISVRLWNPRTGYQLVRVVRRLWAPTFLQIWSPVIGATSFTFLVLAVLWSSLGSRQGTVPTNADGAPPTRWTRVWFGVRCATFVISLTGLNVAGAVYPQLPERGELMVDTRYVSSRTRVKYVLEADGTPFNQYSREGIDHEDLGDDRPRGMMSTIVYQTDGSIVSYEGKPGETRSRPNLLRPPRRSILVMWSPVIASATIPILILVEAVRRQACLPCPSGTSRQVAELRSVN